MQEIIGKSEKDFKELKDLLEECTKGFIACMRFYKFTPKKGKVEDTKPEEFFSIWYPFCEDYKNIWKKEQVRRGSKKVQYCNRFEAPLKFVGFIFCVLMGRYGNVVF